MCWADLQGIVERASLPEGPLKHKNVLMSGMSKHALRRVDGNQQRPCGLHMSPHLCRPLRWAKTPSEGLPGRTPRDRPMARPRTARHPDPSPSCVPPRSRGQWLDRRGVASDPRAPQHGVGGVHRGLLLDVLFELGHHNQDLVRAARCPGTHRGSPGGCMRGVLGVLCPLYRLTGRGGLWLCPRLTMAHHRDMGVPARDRAKAKAMTRAIARRHTTSIIGLLELNGFFACTAGTP
jgi:hypothetical protein